MKPKKKKKLTGFDIALYILAVLILIVTVYPLYFVVIASISEPHLEYGAGVFYAEGDHDGRLSEGAE